MLIVPVVLSTESVFLFVLLCVSFKLYVYGGLLDYAESTILQISGRKYMFL
jgi:hypothetical protein